MQHIKYTLEEFNLIVSKQLEGDKYHTRNWPKNLIEDISKYLDYIAYYTKKTDENYKIAKKHHDENPTNDSAKQNAIIAEEVADAVNDVANTANELAKAAKEANISARNLIKYPNFGVATNTEVAGTCIDPESMAKYDAIVNSAVETICRYYCMAYHFEKIAADCAAPALPPKPTSLKLVNFVNAATAASAVQM